MTEYDALERAIAAGSLSPCAKSQRGVALFDRALGVVVSVGHNAPPRGFVCDGSDACRAACAKVCVHAEQRALLVAGARADGCELVHTKVVDGEAVPKGPPSCVDCSKLVLEAGVARVWLLEGRDGHPELVDYTADDFHEFSLRNNALPVVRNTETPMFEERREGGAS